MNGKFNIEKTQTPTNQDLSIIFTPTDSTLNYTYQIYKNDIVIKTESVQNNSNTKIVLDETGRYKIVVTSILKNGIKDTLESGEYIIDKEKPKIFISSKNVKINPTKDKDIINCTAVDNYSGNLNNKITDNMDEINLSKSGNYNYICSVQDEAGNVASESTNINVLAPSTSIYIIQMICFILLFLLIIKIIRLFKIVKLEERLEPYVIKPLKSSDQNTSEQLKKIYKEFVEMFTSKLKKSVVATKYAKKLDKYTVMTDMYNNGFEILSGKIIVACVLTVLAVIIKAFQFKVLGSMETLGVFTLGFFVLDIYLFARYKIFRWTLESDFIAAITIMNNSFKSGRSIIQAINIVGTEVGGIIGTEFKRMNLELSYGLDIEEVFKRFAERVELEEASYLTASLSVLNKTGGDIIKVFSTIERSLFDKRKLRLELKSLTSGSKIVVYVLLGIPFFFVLAISLINPQYFLPFITTDIGRLLLIFMIIYYIIFVVVVRKIMKVVI